VTEPTTDLAADPASLQDIAENVHLADSNLKSFAAELAEIPALEAILDEAAHGLVVEHPSLTREQAKRMVMVLAYVAWLATLLGLGLARGPIWSYILMPAGRDGHRRSRSDRGGRHGRRCSAGSAIQRRQRVLSPGSRPTDRDDPSQLEPPAEDET
jgi:hypothetical protein